MARNKYPEETVKLIVEEASRLFIEKGYENTSVQDIINHLGGLSKGAIYYHFKSKEAIFEAVCKKIDEDSTAYHDKIRDDKSKNGYEKLKSMMESAYLNPANHMIFVIMEKMMSDPKFLMNQISQIYELVVPIYIQPIIEEGIQDGSIKTAYPKELAEVFMTLLNIWINPIISKGTPDRMKNKLEFLKLILQGAGLDILDSDCIEKIVNCFEKYDPKDSCL